MPRLFDLLPDDTRKELASEAKKPAPAKKRPGRKQKPAVKTSPAPRREYQAKTKGSPKIQPATVPDFVALDVETTGLDFKNDRIIEVGAVRFSNGKPEQEFSTFINAGVPIPEHITRLTGITNEDIRDAPSFSDIAMKLLEFIGNLPLCGHQIEFDANFINAELKRVMLPAVSMQLLDTALLSRLLLQETGRFSLKHVTQTLSVTLDNAHRALHDAKASGEVAALLVPKLSDLPLNVRQTLAACAPGSLFKSMVISTLGSIRASVNLSVGETFKNLPKLDSPEWHLEIDRDEISKTFSAQGDMATIIKNFSPRQSQQDMAQYVTDTLNDGRFLVAEAGTGTGKSLAYLVPAARHALKNNCRVIVSTRTRNLQDQLIQQDLPVAAKLSGENLRYTTLKGRSNYLCRNRWQRLLRGELGNLSPRERIAILPLIIWSETTETGDVEEQNQFNPRWFAKIWNLISAESHDCMGRRCPSFSSCFLHKARQKALGSHIVVINHALFYSDICSENSFLGPIGSIIFDEAHHLQSSGHQHLRTELDTNRLKLYIDSIQNLVQNLNGCKEDNPDLAAFGKKLKSSLKHLRKRSDDFLNELKQWAQACEPELEGEYQIRITEKSLENLYEAPALDNTITDLQNNISTIKQTALAAKDSLKTEMLLSEIQSCAERTSQLKADLLYLVSAKTEDHVFWVEGNHEKRWTKICGVPLDISSILSDVWERCNGGVVFTSATLATGKSTDYFRRAVGLMPFDDRCASVQYQSPYSSDQMIAGGIKEGPDVNNPAFGEYVANTITTLHQELNRNILVLFTSTSMLKSVYNSIKGRSEIGHSNLLVQGYSGSRHAMLEQFKQGSGMILMGTDSFWEGIDAPGKSCEIVIIPRLPFPVPTHPLTRAVAQKFETQNGESFFCYSVPEALIKFRQGAGRLIRTSEDRGALLVLDNRILVKGYGKQFIRSLDTEFNDFESGENMVEKMTEFFDGETQATSTVRYVPLEDV
ncbi:helicase C-terminal domain-containing protein [Chitinispirillales bacterium ANBcel5]|uniref:helicase C-terminal domain-containing protein n=1 Tax=Cellulosispirillum alkaliphilum TaxID=3039283 RepID=UPI002A5434C1|nr:helicase C-terminal domain-containing protein [Chitinispirillales bacterium ANBcel5]